MNGDLRARLQRMDQHIREWTLPAVYGPATKEQLARWMVALHIQIREAIKTTEHEHVTSDEGTCFCPQSEQLARENSRLRAVVEAVRGYDETRSVEASGSPEERAAFRAVRMALAALDTQEKT